jgi:hypothetical protein
MRVLVLACAAIYLAAGAGCAGELAQRPPANDPTSPAAAEAPYSPPPAHRDDPLLTPPAAKRSLSAPAPIGAPAAPASQP